MTDSNLKEPKTVRELLAHVLAKKSRPRVSDIHQILAEDGIKVSPETAIDLARRVRQAEAKSFDNLITHLSETLPKNPKKREIEDASERAGFPLNSPWLYRVVRERLGTFPSLWPKEEESVRLHPTLTATEAKVVERIAGMCGIGGNEVLLFALKALVIAADNGSVSLPEIFAASNRISRSELDAASKVFERLSLKGIK